MNWRLDDELLIEAEEKTSIMKKKVIIGLIFCAMILGVFVADEWQQRRFATLRYGYQCLEQCQYEEAVAAFEKYLDVNSDIYWHLLEAVNRDERYYQENVNNSLEECLRLEEKTYQPGM